MQNNTQQAFNELTPGDYWTIIRRRRYWLLVPTVVVFLASLIIAFSLPPVYRATTTILIEGQQIPSNYVQSTVTEYVEKRIQTITQRVMSRSKLLEIIDQFNLYEDERAKETTEQIITMMRDHIHLESITADVVDQRTGRPVEATIAFTLSFEGENPEKVKKVADRLASLYLEENLKNREEMAAVTTTFLDSELEMLRQNIKRQENKIAEFKNQHFDAMPDLKAMNFAEFQRLDKELESLEQDLAAVRERKIQLEVQLSGIDPDLPGIKGPEGLFADAAQQLEYLQTRYTELKATLSPKHPDLINMEQTIAALQQQVSVDDQMDMKQQQLENLQKELVLAQSQYSDKHPDVVALKQSIALLQQEIAQAALNSSGLPVKTAVAPKNPAYISVMSDIASAEHEIETLLAKRQRMRSRIAELEDRMALAPQVEARFNELQRDYYDAQQRYQEVFDKLMDAQTAESLEKGQKGERFTIIDPAVTPEEPYKPNRPVFLLIGFMLSIGAGLGSAYIKELSDQAIWSENVMAHLTGDTALAVIPHIDLTKGPRNRKRNTTIALAAGAIGSIVFLVLAVHLFYRPLDVLLIDIFKRLI
ncbi:MAG: GNVR domain-containing protein [Thermodesulfobacteriota bacterium]|nr:GNVR domain-containing protein [Thermodesulfobacteriota bacterium]